MEAEQKKDAFLACITFGLLRALVAPQKLKDRTYEQLVAALTTHVAPKPLVIAERTVPQTGQKEVCSKFAELCVWCDVIRDAERQGVLWYEGRGGTEETPHKGRPHFCQGAGDSGNSGTGD